MTLVRSLLHGTTKVMIASTLPYTVIVLHPILRLMKRIRQHTPFPYRTLKTMNMTRCSSCAAEIAVERTRAGSVDPEFGGGQSLGVQRRTVSILIEP